MPHSRSLHLAADLSFVHTDLRWRLPGSWVGFPYYGPDFYRHIARVAERGRFDMLFFGDAAETPENHGGNFDSAVRLGFRWPKHDMSTMIPLMAEASSGVGFGLTVNTTYHHPFHVARLISSLDWVTGGRMGWNSVTGAYKNEAANYGLDVMPEPAERYRRAREHMQVVHGLWNTVEADAIIMDRETGIFADPDKVHLLNHEGEFFKVRGPLPAMPSPQGRPLVIQAGQSPDGMDLAAQYADMQFTSRKTLETIAAHRATLDELTVKHGRSPRDLGCWWAVHVLVADSKKDAAAKRDKLLTELGSDFGLMSLSATFGLDFSTVKPDWTLTRVAEEVQKQKVHWGTFMEIVNTNDPDLTIGEYARERALPQPLLMGSPSDIADEMEERHEAGDENGGFILSPGFTYPRFLEEFVDLVVPELQRRGLVKREYAGSTLRQNLES